VASFCHPASSPWTLPASERVPALHKAAEGAPWAIALPCAGGRAGGEGNDQVRCSGPVTPLRCDSRGLDPHWVQSRVVQHGLVPAEGRGGLRSGWGLCSMESEFSSR